MTQFMLKWKIMWSHWGKRKCACTYPFIGRSIFSIITMTFQQVGVDRFKRRVPFCQNVWLSVFLNKVNYLSRLFGCLSSLSESILESPGHSLHITHTSGSNSTATLSLLTPVEVSHLLCWITAGRTSLLLDVERDLSTTTARSVWLVVSLSEWGGSLSL